MIMTMICDLVTCIGGGRAERQKAGRKESRLMPFPDRVPRLITMPVNDWAIFDQCFSPRDRFYWSTLQKIVDRSERWAERWQEPPELVIHEMFKFAFVEGLGRKRVLGIKRPANAASS